MGDMLEGRIGKDKDLEVTLQCLRHILHSTNSSDTCRSFKVSTDLPPHVSCWRPNLDRIFRDLHIKTDESDEEHKRENSFFKGYRPRENSFFKGYRPRQRAREPENKALVKAHDAPKPSVKSENSFLRGKEGSKPKGNFIPPRRISPPPTKDFSERNPVARDVPRNNLFNTVSSREYSRYDRNHRAASSTNYQRRDEDSYSYPQRRVPLSQSRTGRSHKSFEDSDDSFDAVKEESSNPFKSAHQQLVINDRAKGIKRNMPPPGSNVHVPGLKKTARYDPPVTNQQVNHSKDPEPISENPEVEELMQNPLMKNIDPKMIETVLNEVFDAGSVIWDDIAGLENVKAVIKEIIIWPMLRPDIFTGLRGPPKGILLFGPPGTGKTMIGRLIATQSQSAFFNISASSLTSKWIGDGEKMVRALFAVARAKQPSVIFIDEIDSILTQRSDSEHEGSRRLKTEFLIQFDGCGSKSEDRILVIGVTNRPQELDEAARRRLVKRIYIPLPDVHGRKQLVQNLLRKQNNDLSNEDFVRIAEISEGYSGADMASLCQEASYGPIRDVGVDIQSICADQVRPMALKDFEVAIKHVKASVAQNDLVLYEEWDEKFGCHL